ncbi:methionine-R-sulfoxide reductase B3 isoform X1 [Parus major]|uniref:methionine-R-sulfoxide reductase B3 isoform X1 n=1 Tax=Parus major TaxID=9157 RepID=UPI00144446B2|nr:methionine-R-sulfoxide reductase B3 isoform X1 [Parus major]XP_033370728.1 methionine-R-sulfoxide reductase B3 isoform X1 [Parus major]XP_033370730.1 methionine-R-sulfoxide reductase B3 isoform X1 [Parus major]XP_033370731.1 methionine-R-sulfoxide reductase B3 isoform X1 [Parus major]XP_033370732.1 methionine-R-sulfoxide reductase B3 isoform X1 [Parus major]
MSAFNLLHLVTKSQPVALRACGLPSVFRNVYHQRCTTTDVCSHGPKENKRSCRDKKDCKVVFSQEELRKRLTPLQYHVTQEKGTESAFEGEYTHHKAQGIYKCVVCGTPLFKSETKFDSNSAWHHYTGDYLEVFGTAVTRTELKGNLELCKSIGTTTTLPASSASGKEEGERPWHSVGVPLEPPHTMLQVLFGLQQLICGVGCCHTPGRGLWGYLLPVCLDEFNRTGSLL